MLELPDGRVLNYDDVGDPAGAVVVYLHGAPDCRLARHPDDAIAAGLGVRLVAVDRPGYGRSDPLPRADPWTFGADLEHLLDHLGVGRCRVLAWSAGALWALGAANAMAGRVRAMTTYGAVAPLDAFDDERVAAASEARAHLAAAVRSGDLTGADLAAEVAPLLVPAGPVDVDLARALVVEGLDDRSRAELDSVPGAVDALARSLAEGVAHHGAAGLEADLTVQFTPAPTDVLLGAQCPARFVHGAHDRIAGPAVGEWFSRRLPRGTSECWDDAGHHGLFPRWAELLEGLLTA